MDDINSTAVLIINKLLFVCMKMYNQNVPLTIDDKLNIKEIVFFDLFTKIK